MMEPGWCTEAYYIRTVDGDTVELEIRRRVKIRLRDIDVYESSTPEGEKATEFVKKTLDKSDNRIFVFIPAGDTLKLMDINSFERLVGDIEVNGKDLKELLRENGYEKVSL